jgi:DNA-binding transcriptional LysR family regulator
MNIERLSLDQLRAFATVAEAGSFSAAATRLRRVQSAVSYAVAQLEQQLGVELFDRSGYRPKLTPAGQALLADARGILERADGIIARSQALAAGLEGELSLSVDVMFPVEVLAEMLREFGARYPTVNVRLYVDALGAVAERVLNGQCQLGILATLPRIPKGLKGVSMRPVTLLPVAAPTHPLAKRKGAIPAEALREHVQLVLTDRSTLTEGKDYAVFAAHTWRLSDLGTKHALLLAGLGWGTMPSHMIEGDLKAKRLKRLALDTLPPDGERLPVHLIQRADWAGGPASAWMRERLLVCRE